MSNPWIKEEFNLRLPLTPSTAPYVDSPYISSSPNPTTGSTAGTEASNLTSPPMNINRSSYQTLPPSPVSSIGSQRVSKAKKGKRVHVCEFSGCSKVFTRAEHRRRHELSHKNKKFYTCTHEGCTKAFYRADYLAQHVARHDSPTSVVLTPAIRSGSVSTGSTIPEGPSRSPVVPLFHSIPENIQDSPILHCSNCFNCQNRVGSCTDPCTDYQPTYSYSSADQVPVSLSSAPLLSPLSTTAHIPTGFDTMIDQYLRSVLKPEAFMSSPQPMPSQSPEMISPSSYNWSTNIDPQLPPLHSIGFENSTSTSYPWTSGAESLPAPVQSIRNLAASTRESRNS